MNEPPILRRRVTVLLTSVGNEAIHGFVDDLRRQAPRWRLIGTDIRGDAAGLARCDRGVLAPRREDPRFLETLIKLIRHQGADLLLPLSTEDQDFFSRPEVQARLGLPVVVSDQEAVAAANGKLSLFAALSSRPELLPEHRVVYGPAEALAALAELIPGHGAALLKVDRGAGGAGMLCVGRPPSDPAPVASRAWLDLEGARCLLERTSATTWPRQAVAWLPGSEYSVDLLGDRGELLGGVVRLRRSAVGGMALEAETVDEPEVLGAAELILAELKLSYVNNIQLRRDASERPRLMEINPRIPGTIGLTVAAGLNLPLAACCLALGEHLPLPEPEIGLRVLRYAGSVYTSERFDDPPSRLALPRNVEERQVVLWDLDRTLVRLEISRDDVALWKERLSRRLGGYGWQGGLSPLLPSLEAALDQISKRLTPTESMRLREEIYADLDSWELESLTAVRPIDGALERFLACTEAGIRMAITSNSGAGAVALGLEAMRGWFEARGAPWPGRLVAIHRHPLLRAKASPAIFHAALAKLIGHDETPSLVVIVGDSDHDEEAARALARSISAPVTFIRASEGTLTPLDAEPSGHPLLWEALSSTRKSL